MIEINYLTNDDWLNICKHRLKGYVWLKPDMYMYIPICGSGVLQTATYLYGDIYTPILSYTPTVTQYYEADDIIFPKTVELYHVNTLVVTFSNNNIIDTNIRKAIQADSKLLNISNNRIRLNLEEHTITIIYDDLHPLIGVVQDIIDNLFKYRIDESYRDLLLKVLEYIISLINTPESACDKWRRLYGATI